MKNVGWDWRFRLEWRYIHTAETLHVERASLLNCMCDYDFLCANKVASVLVIDNFTGQLLARFSIS